MNDLEPILQRIVQRAKDSAARFAQQLTTAPDHAQCPVCDSVTILDRSASELQSRLIYVCRQCVTARHEQDFRDWASAAGIPFDVLHATFDNFVSPTCWNDRSMPPAKFLAEARRFEHGEIRNLIMAGTPGIGKGHLAAAIAKPVLAKAPRTVRWIVTHRLFERLHRAYDEGNREAVIEYFARVPLLILDEIAMAEMPKDGERSLYDILDTRQKNGWRTILLSNRHAEVIKSWLGAPIVDRLRSGGVSFLWGDWSSVRGTATDHATF